ncbi:MAG TPA: hypothetical protein VE978_03250 [Chitinophagales bacterium]|nr:hypothetical protein [Chitinophagales bacterium]
MRGDCLKSCIAFSVLISVFIIACSSNKNSNAIIIEGKIPSHGGKKIYLYGFINDTEKYRGIKVLIDSSDISSNGKYFFSIKENTNYLFDLRTKDSIRVTNLFLQPADKLVLNFSKGAQPEIPGDDACSKYNNYLLQFTDSFYRNPDARGMYYVGSNYLTLPDYHTYTAGRCHQQLLFYQHYFSSNPPDSLFANFAISEINYQYGNDNLLFLWKRRMRGLKAIDDSTSYDFLKLVKIENPGALNSPAYFYFLHLYINELYNQEIERRNLTGVNQTASRVAEEKILLAEKYLTGKFREIAELNIDESLGKNFK